MQVGPDKDWSLVFAVFDENKSWYMKENIHNTTQTPACCNDTDPDVYNSHVIYSEFNGYFIDLSGPGYAEISRSKNDRNSLITL